MTSARKTSKLSGETVDRYTPEYGEQISGVPAVPLMSALKNFRPEIDEHLREKKCRAGVCQMHER